MRKPIPAPVVAAVTEMLSQRTTHASLDNLFMHAGAPGESPEGNKWIAIFTISVHVGLSLNY